MIRDPISTAEAGAILKRTPRHIRHLIATGVLTGEPIGGSRDLFLSRAVVLKYAKKPRGRWPKSQAS